MRNSTQINFNSSLKPSPEGSDDGSTQHIVHTITCAIIERRLMPGTKLAEQKVANLFNVSRTIVRQAFNQLSRDHLLVLEPARGAFVATPSAEEAREVFELRSIIEGAMIKALVKKLTSSDLAALRAHLKLERDAVKRGDVELRTRLLAQFHILLAKLHGNTVLTNTLSDLLGRSSLIALMYQTSQSAHHSQLEHKAIVDALQQGDASSASRIIQQHLDSVLGNVQLPEKP